MKYGLRIISNFENMSDIKIPNCGIVSPIDRGTPAGNDPKPGARLAKSQKPVGQDCAQPEARHASAAGEP